MRWKQHNDSLVISMMTKQIKFEITKGTKILQKIKSKEVS